MIVWSFYSDMMLALTYTCMFLLWEFFVILMTYLFVVIYGPTLTFSLFCLFSLFPWIEILFTSWALLYTSTYSLLVYAPIHLKSTYRISLNSMLPWIINHMEVEGIYGKKVIWSKEIYLSRSSDHFNII